MRPSKVRFKGRTARVRDHGHVIFLVYLSGQRQFSCRSRVGNSHWKLRDIDGGPLGKSRSRKIVVIYAYGVFAVQGPNLFNCLPCWQSAMIPPCQEGGEPTPDHSYFHILICFPSVASIVKLYLCYRRGMKENSQRPRINTRPGVQHNLGLRAVDRFFAIYYEER